ncbi:NEW3 domain-containing protein [Deinococcus peraridilitoris]|uniref:Alpha-galactosidase family protein n=1 Tax=Deinococcus peraridilitoris (strain DSM 19664 / LMG 22246 / CIP 109416 / KR-200) TaxID=937777 RepID=L0A2C3_DEIPD|nr:NEW3 domain-containing protein [Deinococcus peraridilitoris]AFZ67337.1 alpha-galactosidase family protein [Deinococcus peraridilitoris DSM 19664]
MLVRRAALVLALTLGLLPNASAQLQLRGGVVEVTERQTATLAVHLSNEGPESRDVQLQLGLPAGWVVLVSPGTLTLAPGEARVEMVVVRVPRSTPAGTHTVMVSVNNVRTEMGVRVPQRDALHVRALSASATNGQAEATFQVRNDGNAPAQVALSAAGQGQPRVTPATLTLAPGEIQDVRVSGSVPAHFAKHSVTLRARTSGAAAEQSISADVLSPAPAAGTARHTLPGEVQVVGGDDGLRFRFSVSGPLTPNVNLRLSVEPRHFEAEVRTPDVRVSLGPTTPGFSSFTVRPPAVALQSEIYNTGLGNLRTYAGLRRDRPGELVAGIELGQRMAWGDARVAVDLAAGGVTTTLAAQAVTPGVTTRGELGVRGDGVAVKGDVDVTLNDNALNVQRVGGGARYRMPGFDSTPTGRADAELRLGAQVSSFGVGANLRGGVNLVTANAVTARDAEFALQVRDTRMELRAGVTWSEQLTTQKTTIKTSFGAGYKFDWGHLKQELTNERTVQAGAQATNALRYSASLDYPMTSGTNTIILKPKLNVAFDLLGGTSRVGGSIEGSWQAENGLRVSAGVSRPDFSQSGFGLNAEVDKSLANGNSLRISLSQNFGPVSSTQARVTARVPFALPLYQRTDMGSLEGRVLDRQGQGIPGLTVQAQSYLAVTDASGTYRFPALVQGDQLVLLRAPAGQWCTPPRNIPVFGRQITRHDLTCVPATSTIMRLVSYVVGEKAEAPLELPGIRVALEGKLGRFEATSDFLGRLTFGDLPIGSYQLSVTPAAPAQFKGLTVELPDTVDLAAGRTELSLRFARKPRVVQMQEENPTIVPSPIVPLPSVPATGPIENPGGKP